MGREAHIRVVWKRLECEQDGGIALLNEAQQIRVPAGMALRDSHDHGKIRFGQGLTCRFRSIVVGPNVSGELRFLRRWSTAER
jgi:hypothetical protein